jgi:hypothetical protein
MDELEIALMPHWAIGSTTSICVGAQLLTKDGRHTGNAVVTGRKHHTGLKNTTYGGVRSWTVLTDAGNSLVLSDEEIKQLFYAPQWVMDVDSCPGNQRQQGADQELEACVEWLAIQLNCTDQEHIVPYLRGCRRPKPQTLSSIALQMLGTIERDGHYLPEITDTIRKAIEALPND